MKGKIVISMSWTYLDIMLYKFKLEIFQNFKLILEITHNVIKFLIAYCV